MQGGLMKRAVFAALVTVSAMIAPLSAGLSNLTVFPNPFRPTQGDTTVTFDGITGGGTLKIYNTAGRLVFEKGVDSSSTSFVWDVKNNAGKPMASGMYIYFIES